MKFKRSFICAVFLLLGTFVYSQEANEVAKLKSATNEALDVLYKEKCKECTTEEKAVIIRNILEHNYDLMVLIRRTMGRNWQLLSTAEQSEVKDLVTQLIVKSFINGLQGLERPTVEYSEPITINDKRFEIPSKVTFSDGRVINIVYRFGRLKTGWQIYDILAEDVSVVSNYRQQFDDHFRNGTGAELIDKMKTLLEEKNTDENPES